MATASAPPNKPTRVLAANPSTARGQTTQLGSSPDGQTLVYCQGRTVVLRRHLDGSTASDHATGTVVYAQHAHPTTVARLSPSGYYCASADVAGNVRVWDVVGDEQTLKLETRPFAGRIVDLQWDAESKRIGVVGEGRERFGHFFLADSGSSCGEVSGHSKVVNSVAFRSQRPFRAVTAGDDCQLVFYTGVPFRFSKKISGVHTRFIHSVAYSPTGDHFVSAGADGKIVLYDGTSGDQLSSFADSAATGSSDTAHKGTIFATSFSPEGKHVASAGADGTVKLWEVPSGKLVQTWDLNGQSRIGGQSAADKAKDQQVGCTFVGKQRIVSVSLSGQLNVFHVGQGSGQVGALFGATKSFGPGAFAKAADASLVGGSYDGTVLRYAPDGTCQPVEGAAHGGSAVLGLATAGKSDSIYSIGMDDSLRRIVGGKYDSFAVAMSGQPRSISVTPSGLAVVATNQGVDVVTSSGQKTSHSSLGFEPTSVAISADGATLAAGAEDGKVRLYSVSPKLEKLALLENGRSSVTALAFNADATLLAAGESNGKILVYDVQAKQLKFNQWIYHTARIHSVRFSPDGRHAVSSSLDSNVYVYSTVRASRNAAFKNVHAGGVQAAEWLDDATVASAGADGSVKVFKITPIA